MREVKIGEGSRVPFSALGQVLRTAPDAKNVVILGTDAGDVYAAAISCRRGDNGQSCLADGTGTYINEHYPNCLACNGFINEIVTIAERLGQPVKVMDVFSTDKYFRRDTYSDS